LLGLGVPKLTKLTKLTKLGRLLDRGLGGRRRAQRWAPY
jgi:hypothetical protein